jgi:putative ABC transport system substrate-binding protein
MRDKFVAVVLALTAILFALSISAHAQQVKKTPVVGYLTLANTQREQEQTFERGLRELGYINGKNISIEWRFAGGKVDRVPELAAELVSLKTDVIVTGGGLECPLAAKNATTTIPIVFINISDPVDLGLVKSLAHPGANITGISNFLLELPSKQLELIREVIPKASRVAVISPPLSTEGTKMRVKELERVAGSLGVLLQVIDWQQAESAFALAKKNRIDAFIILPTPPVLGRETKPLIDLAIKNRLATIHISRTSVENGGLMSYGADLMELQHRAAAYVDKILKGANPADLPVERPTKLELVVNLKTAKQIGLTIPPNVLARADKVIR